MQFLVRPLPLPGLQTATSHSLSWVGKCGEREMSVSPSFYKATNPTDENHTLGTSFHLNCLLEAPPPNTIRAGPGLPHTGPGGPPRTTAPAQGTRPSAERLRSVRGIAGAVPSACLFIFKPSCEKAIIIYASQKRRGSSGTAASLPEEAQRANAETKIHA